MNIGIVFAEKLEIFCGFFIKFDRNLHAPLEYRVDRLAEVARHPKVLKRHTVAWFYGCQYQHDISCAIGLKKDSRDLTSFSTSNGSYRFTRLPYGLKIAPKNDDNCFQWSEGRSGISIYG